MHKTGLTGRKLERLGMSLTCSMITMSAVVSVAVSKMHHSIAYSLSNICAKNYQNRLMCVEVIVCNNSVVFLRHSVVVVVVVVVVAVAVAVVVLYPISLLILPLSEL